jgi:hypothetical protein
MNRSIVPKTPLELQLVPLLEFPVHHLLILLQNPFSLAARGLQYALLDMCLGHVRYPWCMYRFHHEIST